MRLLFIFLFAIVLNLSNVIAPNDLTVRGNKSFSNDTFQFEYPNNWRITDEEFIEEDIFYLSIEKKGLNDSGIYTIISYEGEYYLDELITINIDELKSNSFMANFTNSKIEDSQFGSYQVRNSNFKFNTLGIKHAGEMFTFSTETHTFYILRQGANEDQSKNKEGFQLIEQSFKAK